jgi:hypothetical protein
MPIESENTHTNRLIDNIHEVQRLAEIHQHITGGGAGRKHDVEILHKSAIVLLIACWEAFVEDLAQEALTATLAKASNPNIFPDSVLERIASKVTGKKIWNLSGDGWKDAFRDNLKEIFARTTDKLNTPRPENVDEIFLKVLGIQKLSSSWRWKGRTAENSRKKLDELVSLRCAIAHRVTAASRVNLKDVVDCTNLISRLAARSHNTVCKHLTKLVGESPWEQVTYKKTG